MVLIFVDLNKAQVYKMPYRDSSQHEIEIPMSFIYSNSLKPNEHREYCHIRKANHEIFPFEIGIKKIFM